MKLSVGFFKDNKVRKLIPVRFSIVILEKEWKRDNSILFIIRFYVYSSYGKGDTQKDVKVNEIWI